MDEKRLKEIFQKIENLTVAVYGDFCLDAYWILDDKSSEISVETGLKCESVKKHYYNLGGASNIVANLAALKPKIIKIIGVIGEDLFGRELKSQLEKIGVDSTFLTVQKNDFSTYTFGKRYMRGQEKPRIDFGFLNKRKVETDKVILRGIEEALIENDVIIFNQQIPNSITNSFFIDEVNSLFKKYNEKIVLLDSRHYGKEIKYIYRKLNEYEAASLVNSIKENDKNLSGSLLEENAEKLFSVFGKPVFITRGEKGISGYAKEGFFEISGIHLTVKKDSVGCGDTVTSSIALCLGAGLSPVEASEFANYAATVTVQKIFRTGTATKDEILEVYKNHYYIFNYDLAEDFRKAEYFKDSEIELCLKKNNTDFGNIKHAIFDHDGTISTLRQDWENVMEKCMMKSILGDKLNYVDINTLKDINKAVKDYIDISTGIQTIEQMEALVEFVKEFGFVQKNKILNKFEYKKIYNKEILKIVKKRADKFLRGELDVNDFIIKGAVDFLNILRDKKIKLYLASGTDLEDVRKEAKILGYAYLFDGGIYGAVDDIKKYSKKMVIENIINSNNLRGPELVVFGDGPVELREVKKKNGIAIGVASDEIRRFGLNYNKRSRLIKAGAHLIIPDFSQRDNLMEILSGRYIYKKLI
jgi:ADP-heptose synthase, bifunctional sugar kinase/adenylyltransferase